MYSVVVPKTSGEHKNSLAKGYGAAGEGRYVRHVLQVATLRLDQGQGKSLLVAGGALPVVVMVVAQMAQVASPKCSHLGPETDCFPAHVHGVR